MVGTGTLIGIWLDKRRTDRRRTMDYAQFVRTLLETAAADEEPVVPGDVAEVRCHTTRDDTCVTYQVLVSLRSLEAKSVLQGDTWVPLWQDHVNFGQTDATVAGGSAFREMARKQEAIAEHLWQATR